MDSPGCYQYFLAANQFEEDLQHNLSDKTALTPGLKACLRGLWRGRARHTKEQSEKNAAPKGAEVVE